MSDQSEFSLDSTDDGDPDPGDGSPNRRNWVILGVLTAIVLGFVLWLVAVNQNDSDVISDVGETTLTTTPSSSGPESSGPDSTSPESGEPEVSPTTQSTLPDEAAGGITDVEGAAATPVSVPASADASQATITSVRTARHEGFDRVVFEFDGPVPGYEVKYTERPIKGDASDKEVKVDGASIVTVRMTPASAVVLDDDGYHESSDVPDHVSGAGSIVKEVVEVGDFEGQATWAVGLTDKVDFAVSTLASPSRVVIDFVNH